MKPKYDFSDMPSFVAMVRRACNNGVGEMGKYCAESEIKAKFSKVGRFASSPRGTPPAKHSGNLSNSVTVVPAGDLVVKVGPTVIYGHVHEFGKEIAALNVRYLRIPINDAAKRWNETGGVKSLRSGAFKLFRSKRGNLIASGAENVKYGYYKTTVMGKRVRVNLNAKPVFLLKPTVSIPPRPFLRPALKRMAGNRGAVTAFVSGVGKVLRKSGIKVRNAE